MTSVENSFRKVCDLFCYSVFCAIRRRNVDSSTQLEAGQSYTSRWVLRKKRAAVSHPLKWSFVPVFRCRGGRLRHPPRFTCSPAKISNARNKHVAGVRESAHVRTPPVPRSDCCFVFLNNLDCFNSWRERERREPDGGRKEVACDDWVVGDCVAWCVAGSFTRRPTQFYQIGNETEFVEGTEVPVSRL